MIGAFEVCLIFLQRSKPEPSGSDTSRIAKSYFPFTHNASASPVVRATSISYPCFFTAKESPLIKLRSSSSKNNRFICYPAPFLFSPCGQSVFWRPVTRLFFKVYQYNYIRTVVILGSCLQPSKPFLDKYATHLQNLLILYDYQLKILRIHKKHHQTGCFPLLIQPPITAVHTVPHTAGKQNRSMPTLWQFPL